MKSIFIMGTILTLGLMWAPTSLDACAYTVTWQNFDADKWSDGGGYTESEYGGGSYTPRALAYSWMESGNTTTECEAWITNELVIDVISGTCELVAKYDTDVYALGSTSSGDWWGYAWAASGPSGCFYYDAYTNEEDGDSYDFSGGTDWDYVTLYDEDTYSYVQLSHAQVGISSGTGIEVESRGRAYGNLLIREPE